MRLALLASLAAFLAVAVPAAQADPVHLYTGEDGRVGVQEHATPVGFGVWVEGDGGSTELHVRFFFTHCIAEVEPKPGEVVCAV